MKTSSLAVAAFLVLGSFAAPVLAAEDPSFDADWYVTQLQQKGINAVDAHEGWNGNFRATVVLADGKQVFQYFDTDSLQPVAAGNGNTRVLSKLDVGADAAKLPLIGTSLMTENDD